MYQYFNNTLCIPAKAIYSDFKLLSYEAYKKQCSRGNLTVVRRACRNRPALLSYDLLPEQFKQEVFKNYGSPYPIVITKN